MSYNKTTWANGDVITAEKLNNIEDGIAGAGGGDGGIYIIHAESSSTDNDFSVTVEENVADIKNAIESGLNVIMDIVDQGGGTTRLGLANYGLTDDSELIDFISIPYVDVQSPGSKQTSFSQLYVSYDGDNTWYAKNTHQIINGN